MKKTCIAMALVAACLGFLKLHAQEVTQTNSSPRLPTYYGKLAVNDSQREQMYGILKEYDKEIEELQKKIKSLLKERDGKMEALLSPGQRLRLEELKAEALKRSQKPLSEQPVPNAATTPE